MKSTKKSLLLSTLSFVLCFAMLLGTTFAWFTDEVQSGVNKIVAGNLDIEVSYKDGEEWKSIEGVDSLFSKGLWEPGHTEYVTLKIENKGTLALTYKMMVTPVNEAGGINMAGQPFKLSDYLMFGTTEANTTETTYTRETARAAAGNTMKLNQADLVKTAMMAKDAPAQYVTLVVYMPESVGNEANYKTGTAAPTIDLGIKVVATQVENENDSFGNDYDGTADTVAPFSVGPIYDYFPQVVKTEPVVVENGAVKTATTIEVKESETAGAQTLASVTVPVGVQLNENVNELTLKVTPQAITADYTAEALNDEIQNENREIANFDVKVEGVASGNTTNLTVKVFIGKGLANVKIYHNGDLIDDATYDSTTGMATFETPTFSDYTMAYDKAVAAIGTKTYGTLELAINAAQDGDTVDLLKDVTVKGTGVTDGSGGGTTLRINKDNVTLNGHGFTLTEGESFDVNGKCSMIGIYQASGVTVKNLTIVGNNHLGHGINIWQCTTGNIKVENVTVKNATRYAVVVNESTATIDGLTTVKCGWGGVNVDKGTAPSATIKNCTIIDVVEGKESDCVKVEKGSATIESGTYAGVNAVGSGMLSIFGGTFSSNPSSYVAAGYGAVESNGKWTVTGTWSSMADTTWYVETDTEFTLNTADALAGLAKLVNEGKNFSGKTVKLGADINLAEHIWNPIGRGGKRFQGTFDGQNHTIKNLTSVLDSTSGTQYGNGLFGDITGGATLKNFTVENANVYDIVEGKGNVYGIVCGYAYGNVTFENITVKNSKISAFGKVAAILGMAADKGGTTTIKNCKVEDTEITGAYNCATFAGLTQNTVSMSGNTQTNVTYKYSSRYGAEAYTDLDTTAASSDAVNGKYWKYNDEIYYAAWADQYNEQKETTISDGSITLDAIVHN